MTDEMRTIILRQKNLNGRGNGGQETRRVLLPDGTSGWASELAEDVTGDWSSGTFLAADRRCCERGKVPVGTIVLAYDSTLRGGKKNGRAQMTAGVVLSVEAGRQHRKDDGKDDGKSSAIAWGGISTRRRGKFDVEIKNESGQWIAI